MKKIMFIRFVIMSLMITMMSCNDDSTTDFDARIDVQTSENLIFERTARATNKIGYITSQNGEPIQNVKIKNGDRVIGMSNDDGSFSIEESRLGEGDVLTFENEEFVTVSKVIRKNMMLAISMKKRVDVMQIDTRITNQIEVGNGGRIVIPANVLGYNNERYSGVVNIQATHIDVTNSFDLRSAPGSYIAQGNNGLYPLTSFGMIEIVATIPEENIRLDIVEGEIIQVEFPILQEINTPETVNLYNFNMDTGYWVQTGVLINTGATLLGELTTINSAWNADEPCADALVCVKLKVEYTNGDFFGCGVSAQGLSYQGFDGAYFPDANGYVSLMVCPNSAFELLACKPQCEPCPHWYSTIIDLSTVTTPPDPDGCIDLGTWSIVRIY